MEHQREGFETVEQLAARWHVPVSWVYARTAPNAATQIPHLKLGKYCRFQPSIADAWLQSQQAG